MAKFKLTRHSDSDLEASAEYTLRTWGEKQCERYLDELQASFQELADNPLRGRTCDDIRAGLMRMENGRHVVFYRQKVYGIRVIRILHQRMLPDKHVLDEKE